MPGSARPETRRGGHVTYHPDDRGSRGTVYGGRPGGAVYGEGGPGRTSGRASVPTRGARPDDPLDAGRSGGAGRGRPPQRPVVGKPRRSRVRVVLLTLLILVLVLVVGGVAAGVYQLNKIDGQIERVGNVFAEIPADSRPAPGADGATNILLIGTDAWKNKPPRSDTIMVVHLPANRERAYIVSIPRDAWVPIPGRGRAKINAAYAWGGPALLVQTVEQFTDLRIDHFAHISFDGFEAMTDAVGGVTMPKVGRLNGKEALVYVRERKSLPNGDFDRIKRQQAFVRQLLAESMSTSNPLELLRLADAMSKAFGVDDGLTGGELRSLALSMRNIRGSDIEFTTAPNKGSGWAAGQSVVYLDPEAGVELWTAMRNDQMAAWVAAQPKKN
jgi:anionic cell wall polymer biosynthesis LytR-Cps2A-Psr (LCP) family protein